MPCRFAHLLLAPQQLVGRARASPFSSLRARKRLRQLGVT
jgi:hypothetical protein